MTKVATQKVIEYLQEKWKNPCPMCGDTDWRVQPTAFELREFHGGGLVVTRGPIIPVIPVMCGNCGNTVLVSAILAGAVDQEKGGNDVK